MVDWQHGDFFNLFITLRHDHLHAALTFVPDKGGGQLDAIASRRNSEPILEQPAEM